MECALQRCLCKWNKLMRGAAGGLAGTLAHSAVMLAGRALGLGGKLPPKESTDELVESLGIDPGEHTRTALTVANHIALGATTCALFGLVQPPMSRGKSMLAGAAYGLAVWFASYEGWVPHVLGAMRRAHRDRWDRQAYLVAAHVAFGAALDAVRARPARGSRPRGVACGAAARACGPRRSRPRSGCTRTRAWSDRCGTRDPWPAPAPPGSTMDRSE